MHDTGAVTLNDHLPEAFLIGSLPLLHTGILQAQEGVVKYGIQEKNNTAFKKKITLERSNILAYSRTQEEPTFPRQTGLKIQLVCW